MKQQLLLNPPGVINYYTNPFQVRKWLGLLEPDQITGFRIKPGLRLDRHTLGFSFSSNGLGLRGPCAQEADNMIVGTSYAMSFTVDNGRNWYEQGFAPHAWLNLGLPVGLPQIEELFRRYYRGAAGVALVLYHPNYWVTTRNYEKWRMRGATVFETFNWETDLRRCFRLYAKKLKRQNVDIEAGRVILFKHAGVKYHVNAEYNYFEFDKHPDIVALTVRSLHRMVERFMRIVVVRAQIKQELVPEKHRNGTLVRTLESYRIGWQIIKKEIQCFRQVEFHEADGFTLEDFQPYDTHWNATGNARFSEFVRKIL